MRPSVWSGVAVFLAVSLFYFLRSKNPRKVSGISFFRDWFFATFSKEDLKKRSFHLDLQWYLIKALKLKIMFSPVLSFGMILSVVQILHLYDTGVGHFLRTQLHRFSIVSQNIILFTLAFLIHDFANYLIHRLFHTSEILWTFHKVHHYPTQLNYLGGTRSHPVEDSVTFIFTSLFAAFCLSFLLPVGPELFKVDDFLDKRHLLFITLVFWPRFFQRFNHTKFPVSFGKVLNSLFVCPRYHIFHHTNFSSNRNFGIIFSFWDRLFGTYYFPRGRGEEENALQNLGVAGMGDDHYRTLVHALCGPFVELLEKGLRRVIPFRKQTTVL